MTPHRMASGEKSWRLHLRVEDTSSFDIEYAEVHRDLAVAGFRREKTDAAPAMPTDSVAD